MARQAPEQDGDLVPYYRPGATEPEMVPRSEVPDTEENEPADDATRALDSAEGREVRPSRVKKAANKKATKKVARKK